jgi:hypothetical protein
MKKIISILTAVIFIISAFLFFPSCDPTEPNETLNNLGWFGLGGTMGDDLTEIEDGINLSNLGSGNSPSSIDLSSNFPPIGDQGQYGTCVAWAVGYNHKSTIHATANGTAPTTTSLQFSPKYLFWAIPASQKGADCNGTGFEPAYDVLLNNGITTLATTPYTSLGDCSSQPSASENTAAEDYKIQSYREVDASISEIKKYLSQGRALAFGAKLGDNFMAWNNSDVLYSDTYGYSGQHAYHAMSLCGYDDNKGNNGAFRVVNSWGTGWGDGGYIWVDYNFFVGGDFAFCVFAATNVQTDPDQNGGEDGVVDDPNSGKDLMAWELYDDDNGGGLDRIARYNAYNVGNEAIPATDDWNMIYIYYNAQNANDYGILLYDYYSNDYGNYGDDGDLYAEDPTACYGLQNWYNHINIPAAVSVAHALYGGDPTTDRFSWPYTMPEISGEYYLVMIVDGFNAISEFDESNNYFYLTDSQGGPITFLNGIMQENPAKSYVKSMNPQKGDSSPKETVRTEQNLNTYTLGEIRSLVNDRLETGDMQKKVAEFVKTNNNTNRKTNN